MKRKRYKNCLIFLIFIFFITSLIIPSTGIKLNNKISKNNNIFKSQISLPVPDFTDSNLELCICRRMSVREFDQQPVSEQELSNILWAAYGYTSNGKRTIHSPNGNYCISIYIIRADGTYKYKPETHSLLLFRSKDFTHIGQYDTAPIKIGLVWDKRKINNGNMAWAEIGMMAQNIYFEANALNLGTVTTATEVSQLYQLLLPIYEKPLIIMPLGHPLYSYDFTYDPLPPTNLPSVTNNSMSLENAINNRSEITIWNKEPLSGLEQSQIIWASYGYSYFIDNLNNKRHRTVPSSHGTYPLHIFAANNTGIFQYFPKNHSIIEIAQGDKREDISRAVESESEISTASWILISFVDIDVINPDYLQAWYYEAGAIAHNVFLECTAMNLSANIGNIIDDNALRSALGIPSQTNLLPLFIMPSGKTTFSNPPEIPTIYGQTNGKPKKEYTYTVKSNDPDGDNISYLFDWGDGVKIGWTEFVISGKEIIANHSWKRGNYLIKVKARDIYGAESDWGTLKISMPQYKVENDNFLYRLINRFTFLRKILFKYFS